MIIIALVLALVEKPMTTWTWLNMLLMLTNVTSNPIEKGIMHVLCCYELSSPRKVSTDDLDYSHAFYMK